MTGEYQSWDDDRGDPFEDWEVTRDEAIARGDIEVCGTCYEYVLPDDAIRDPEQLQWLGQQADAYCSDQCLDAAQEQAFEHASTRGVK